MDNLAPYKRDAQHTLLKIVSQLEADIKNISDNLPNAESEQARRSLLAIGENLKTRLRKAESILSQIKAL